MFEAQLKGNLFDSSHRERMIVEADSARDQRQFEKAEFLYFQVLNSFRDTDGYIVQYGHCLKEQGKFDEAEFFYRDAINRGVPLRDIEPHLEFVCARQNRQTGWYNRDPDVARLPKPQRPPNSTDIAMLSWALRDDPLPPMALRLDIIRRSRTNTVAAALMTESSEFKHRNRNLLYLISR
jgi:tetratricopeptide (TPR) repeat protein